MPVALVQKYDTLTMAEQKEVEDFVSFVISRRKTEVRTESPIDKFFGCMSDDDANALLTASAECRKIEGQDEW